MRWKTMLAAVMLVVATCVAQAQTRTVQQKNLDRYLKYAGAPIDRFQFWKMYQWELVGPDKVVVWTTVNDAYLITVEQPCPQLEWANAIGVTSTLHQVTRQFDFVTARRDKCHIKEIRPIDYKALKKDEMQPGKTGSAKSDAAAATGGSEKSH